MGTYPFAKGYVPIYVLPCPYLTRTRRIIQKNISPNTAATKAGVYQPPSGRQSVIYMINIEKNVVMSSFNVTSIYFSVR